MELRAGVRCLLVRGGDLCVLHVSSGNNGRSHHFTRQSKSFWSSTDGNAGIPFRLRGRAGPLGHGSSLHGARQQLGFPLLLQTLRTLGAMGPAEKVTGILLDSQQVGGQPRMHLFAFTISM